MKGNVYIEFVDGKSVEVIVEIAGSEMSVVLDGEELIDRIQNKMGVELESLD